MASSSSPVVIITEQPAGFYRYRYESEGKSKIPGAHSKPNNKTYPSIQILGYVGKVLIIISCVSKDKPHKRHPHNIVGNGENFKHGIYVDYVTVGATNTFTFPGLGIQCISVKKDKQKKAKKSKPERSTSESDMDLTVVRLKFEVYLRGPTKYDIRLDPVYSEPIYNATAYPSLTICKLSHFSSPTAGGQTILLFCDKVNKEDIEVIFFEEILGQTVWEAYGTCLHVHRTFGISLVTPKYGGPSNMSRPIKCYIQLKRKGDGERSEPREFDYTTIFPNDVDSIDLKRKRVKQDIMFQKLFALEKPEPSTSSRTMLPNPSQLPISNYECFPVTSDNNRIQQSLYLEAGVSNATMLEQQTIPITTYDSFPGTSAAVSTLNTQVNDFGYGGNNFITNNFEGQELLNFIQHFEQSNRSLETNQNQEPLNFLHLNSTSQVMNGDQNMISQNIDEVHSEQITSTTDELLLSFCNEVIQTNLEEEKNLSGQLKSMMLMDLMN